MDGIALLRRLREHDEWANREALASLRRAPGAPPRALALLAHVAAAEWLWIDRLHGAPPRLPVWPDLSLDGCEGELDGLLAAWPGVLDEVAREPGRPVGYTNSKGERYTSTAVDIVTHVLTHSGYHRGQIATLLRAAGREPAYTDFIHAVRQGFVA